MSNYTEKSPLIYEYQHKNNIKILTRANVNHYGCPYHIEEEIFENKSNCKNIDDNNNNGVAVKIVENADSNNRIPALGIILALLSVVCYSLGSAIVNLLPELHPIEVLLFRSLSMFLSFSIITVIRQYKILPEKGHGWYLVLRCVAGTTTLSTVYVAFRLMPLADASTIQFSSPVFVAIFAYFVLKEGLTWLQGVAGIVTLAGVIVIARPEFIFGAQSETIYDQRLMGTILAVVSSLSGAFSMIALRKLKTTPVAVIVMWFGLTTGVVGVIILVILDAMIWPEGIHTWSLLCGVGICGVLDQYLLSKAMQYEKASPVTIARTFTVVMTFIWEALLLGKSIEWMSVIGASLITFCILVLAMEKWHKESPQLFVNLCGCRHLAKTTDSTDETTRLKKDFSDNFNTFYNNLDNHNNNNHTTNHVFI